MRRGGVASSGARSCGRRSGRGSPTSRSPLPLSLPLPMPMPMPMPMASTTGKPADASTTTSTPQYVSGTSRLSTRCRTQPSPCTAESSGPKHPYPPDKTRRRSPRADLGERRYRTQTTYLREELRSVDTTVPESAAITRRVFRLEERVRLAGRAYRTVQHWGDYPDREQALARFAEEMTVNPAFYGGARRLVVLPLGVIR